jgi:ABC-type uncharacterized transport system fused permease/ATPase subunit
MSDLELTMMRRVGELKAEVERLNKFNEEALAHIAKEERKSRERLDMEQAENARLKAEVERLTKAGDELVGLLEHMDVIVDMDSDHPEVEAWNAAKEGKPRA